MLLTCVNLIENLSLGVREIESLINVLSQCLTHSSLK